MAFEIRWGAGTSWYRAQSAWAPARTRAPPLLGRWGQFAPTLIGKARVSAPTPETPDGCLVPAGELTHEYASARVGKFKQAIKDSGLKGRDAKEFLRHAEWLVDDVLRTG